MKFLLNKKAIFVLSLIIIGVVLWLVFDKNNTFLYKDNIGKNASSTEFRINELTEMSGVTYSEDSRIIPIDELPKPIPDMNKPVVFKTNLNEPAKAQINKAINDYADKLNKDPSDFISWLSLGLYRNTAGDVGSAVEAWEYASKLKPSSYIPLVNLMNAYGYYLNDSLKAVDIASKIIAIESPDSYPYVRVAMFYVEVLNDKNKAREVLNTGMKFSSEKEALAGVLDGI